jgi:hypothetical protein
MANTAREEAERLVATVLAMAARSGLGGAPGGWATGSAECCVCPICRVIAGLRDPRPQSAERLAAGAGDVATVVASLLRTVSAMAGATRPGRPAPAGDPAAPSGAPPDPRTTWTAATRTPGRDGEPPVTPDDGDGVPDSAGDGSPWSSATRMSARAAAEAAEAARAAARAEREARAAQAERDARAERAAREAERRARDRARAAADPRADPDLPAFSGDVWAAATGDPGVVSPPSVDHDDAGEPTPGDDGAA